MTITEYNNLTEREAEYDELKYANRLYMAIAMDKFEFCNEVKAHPHILESQIVFELLYELDKAKKDIQRYAEFHEWI